MKISTLQAKCLTTFFSFFAHAIAMNCVEATEMRLVRLHILFLPQSLFSGHYAAVKHDASNVSYFILTLDLL